MGPDGSLTETGGSPFPIEFPPYTVSGTAGMAFAPDGARAVVSFFFNGGAFGLSVGADGSLAPAQAPLATPPAAV